MRLLFKYSEFILVYSHFTKKNLSPLKIQLDVLTNKNSKVCKKYYTQLMHICMTLIIQLYIYQLYNNFSK